MAQLTRKDFEHLLAFRSSLRGPVLAKRIGVSRALLRDALFGLVREFACALGLSNGVSWALIRFMWFFDRRQRSNCFVDVLPGPILDGLSGFAR